MKIFWKIFNQVAHFVIGALAVFVMMLPIIIWFREFRVLALFAVVIVMIFAWRREMKQHPGQCNIGCITDMIFWFLGSASMATVILLVLDSLKYVIGG